MGDRRFEPSYRRLVDADEPLHEMTRLTDDAIIEALAATSRSSDAYLANVLATEALNRLGRVRTALDHLAEGVVAIDARGAIRLLNPAAERLLRVSMEAVIGQDFHDAYRLLTIAGAPIPREERPFTRALRGEVVEGEFAARLLDGSVFEMGLLAAPIQREGEIVGAIMAVRDVTEKRRRTQMLQAFMDASLDAVVAIDPASRVLFWSRAATEIFGYPAEQAVGRDLAELIVPERLRDAHHAGIARYLATGKPRIAGRRYQMPAMRSDGSEFPAEISILRAELDEPTFVGFVRDLSSSRSPSSLPA